MRIGVFAYDFEHWKTQQGIHNLVLHGRKPRIILAAPRVELTFYRSQIRLTPKDLFLTHPKNIAEYYGIDYRVVPHNSKEAFDLIAQYNLDLGVILGARILKPSTFQGFRKGVLNMHPGILPENRGLDNIKWAVMNDLSQGVTTHLIDREVDRGLLVQKEMIRIYEDDTLLDVQIRIQHLEQRLMLSSIDILEKKCVTRLKSIGKGDYNKCMPPGVESGLMKKFAQYKKTIK